MNLERRLISNADGASGRLLVCCREITEEHTCPVSQIGRMLPGNLGNDNYCTQTSLTAYMEVRSLLHRLWVLPSGLRLCDIGHYPFSLGASVCHL